MFFLNILDIYYVNASKVLRFATLRKTFATFEYFDHLQTKPQNAIHIYVAQVIYYVPWNREIITLVLLAETKTIFSDFFMW
jgi:hypothetical protein